MGVGKLVCVGLLVAACAVDNRTPTAETPASAGSMNNAGVQTPGADVPPAAGAAPDAPNEMDLAADRDATPAPSNESSPGSTDVSSPPAAEPAASEVGAPLDPGGEGDQDESSEPDPQPPPDDGEPGEPPPASPSEPAPPDPLPPELLANGALCTESDECSSNLCSDARCCQTPCGACRACLGPSGTCTPVTDSVDADSCAAPRLCGASATCLTIDQVQTQTDFNVTLAGAGVSRFAQVVLPARSGTLSELVLAVLCFSGSASLELQGVVDGQPDGVVAYGDTFVPEPMGDTTRVVIEPPLAIRAGFPFAIVLDAASGAVSCSATSADGDVYTRGGSFIEDPRAPGEWFSFDGDLRFETRVAQ